MDWLVLGSGGQVRDRALKDRVKLECLQKNGAAEKGCKDAEGSER